MYKTIDHVNAYALEVGDTFEDGAVFTVKAIDDQGDNIHLTVLDEFEDEVDHDIHPNTEVPLLMEVDDEDEDNA